MPIGMDLQMIRRRPSLNFATIAAIIALGFMRATAIYAANEVGNVLKVSGIAHIQRDGTMISATPGAPLRLHDVVTTANDASATLGFADGSSMILAEASSVSIEDSVSIDGKLVPIRVTLLNGKVETDVADKNGGSQRLVVDTPATRTIGPAPAR
jgi:hypothetical protein